MFFVAPSNLQKKKSRINILHTDNNSNNILLIPKWNSHTRIQQGNVSFLKEHKECHSILIMDCIHIRQVQTMSQRTQKSEVDLASMRQSGLSVWEKHTLVV